jgi:hypothetical protein
MMTRKNFNRTPRKRILLEKLQDSQIVNISPAFYETRKFVTVLTTAANSVAILSQINPAHSRVPTTPQQIFTVFTIINKGTY